MIHDLNEHDMQEIIYKYLPIRTKEKNAYGEVFTPPELIEKIFGYFPTDVWKNPNLTWLDPTCGIGNFMIIVYKKLMTGLAYWEPDKRKRSNYIIENMLYMVEINKRNVFVSQNIFGKNANIIKRDFLNNSPLPKDSFDVIIGNPPFQDDIGDGKKRAGGKNKLYERILLKCLQLLNKNGIFSFITPDNLFSGGSKAYLEIIQCHINMICFDKSLKNYFPNIQQHMCYFVVTKETPGFTKIIANIDDNIEFECQLVDRPVNPIRNWTKHTEFLVNQYISSQRNMVIYNRGKSIDQYNNSGKYPLIYKSSGKLYTNNLELAVGWGVKKIVLFLISPNLEFETDLQGKYGVGPNTFYIPIKNKNERQILENFLKSDIYKTLALATKTNRQFLKIKFIEHLNFAKIIQKSPWKTRNKKIIKNNTRKIRKK